jgi:hypothetical protein
MGLPCVDEQFIGVLVSTTVATVVPVGVLLAVALVSRGELAPVGR